MNILILYASAGRGHQVAAEALAEHFQRTCPETTAHLADILDYTPGWFRFFYADGYAVLATRMPYLWYFFYTITRWGPICFFFRLFCRLVARRAASLVIAQRPAAVISTHFFPSDIVARLKAQKRCSARLFTVITDFCVHPLWLNPHTDTYFVASDHTAASLRRSGITADTIKVFGIPLRQAMVRQYVRSRREPCALLITGSFGFSAIERIVDALQGTIALVVVCGRNERLRERLARRQRNDLTVYGFTGAIAELMANADLIITKPGGLTIAEALASELPMVLIPGIPGQETENARIMEECGCALRAPSLASVKEIVTALANSSEKIEALKKNIRMMKKPLSTQQICAYVCSYCTGSSG